MDQLTGCAAFPALFQDQLLEEPPRANAAQSERRRYQLLIERAARICQTCPVVTDCLYRAVVEHDVAGYVAGTTESQRHRLRARLGITVQPEDLDTLAGVTGGHRQVDHDEVVRLRRANPDESLEALAHRLGCSLSTVKRHLRRARAESASVIHLSATHRPTRSQLMRAYENLLGERSDPATAA